ncbi:MAG: 6-phosphofructokinase [bacterium]
MRIAFSTQGGDCAGLGAAFAGAILAARRAGSQVEIVGVRDGLRGLVYPDRYENDGLVDVSALDPAVLMHERSTVLGSSRLNPYSDQHPGAVAAIRGSMKKHGIDALTGTGGDDSAKTFKRLSTEDGIAAALIAKTIDKDPNGVATPIGASTAIEKAREDVKSVAASGTTHERYTIMIGMGRKAGFIIMGAGEGVADFMLVPEIPFDLTPLADALRTRKSATIFASEGVITRRLLEDPLLVRTRSVIPSVEALLDEEVSVDEFDNPKLDPFITGLVLRASLGLGLELSLRETKQSIRLAEVGFAMRGLRPNDFDVRLGLNCGQMAVEALAKGLSGKMVGTTDENDPDAVEVLDFPDQLTINLLDRYTPEDLIARGVFGYVPIG